MSKSPLVSFYFTVEWGGTNIGFSEVSGLTAEHEVLEYRHGAMKNFSTLKIPGLRKFSNIVLKRGAVANDNELFEWFNTAGIGDERRDITINQLNNDHEPVISWRIINAWPVTLKFAALNAMQSEILIESLEIAHEGFDVRRTK